jgi:hypothetical protein
MKPAGFSFFYGACLALLMIGPALGADSSVVVGRGESGRNQEEVICIGPGSLTGKAVNATTILTPHFSAYRCSSHYPVFISVHFKDTSVVMKYGDTVTLKGRLVAMQDAHRGEYGLVLKDAEIVQ